METKTKMWLTIGPFKLKESNISTKHNRLKNPIWREAGQLAIYKHYRGVELGPTEKQQHNMVVMTSSKNQNLEL